MSKANSQTMTIRVPSEIAKALFKLRDTKNLPTVGSALKVWIDEEINRQRDMEFFKLRESLEQKDELITNLLIKAHRKINLLAFGMEVLTGQKGSVAKEIVRVDRMSIEELKEEIAQGKN